MCASSFLPGSLAISEYQTHCLASFHPQRSSHIGGSEAISLRWRKM
jgi:hypothetical protein